jgi:hypothetical protein
MVAIKCLGGALYYIGLKRLFKTNINHVGYCSKLYSQTLGDGHSVITIFTGFWRSSKTAGIQVALSNSYLKAQGLYELRLGWIALHH